MRTAAARRLHRQVTTFARLLWLTEACHTGSPLHQVSHLLTVRSTRNFPVTQA